MRVAIFDIDGTLACARHRMHLRPKGPAGDWRAYLDPEIVQHDAPIAFGWAVLEVVRRWSSIVFVSGRSEDQREVTCRWLARHGGGVEPRVYLRGVTDRTPSHVYKCMVLEKIRAEGLSAWFAAEDDPKDLQMYARAGLSVLLVAGQGREMGAGPSR
jgi:hypothetical protein